MTGSSEQRAEPEAARKAQHKAGRNGRDTVLALLSVTAVAVLAAAGGLMLWTLIPMLFGWSSAVVTSGSMHPQIEPGDVVVTAPIPEGRLRAGYVVRFTDPSRDGRSVLHRIARISDDGQLITKGDANATVDSSPVPSSAVIGMGRLRVPYVGLPVLWWMQRDYLRLALFAAALVVLCLLVPTHQVPVEDDDVSEEGDDEGRVQPGGD